MSNKRFVLLIVGFLLFLCTSCSIRENSDSKYCKENVVSLINSLSTNNEDKIKLSFAENLRSENLYFEKNVRELLEYFEGDYISNTDIIPTVTGGYNEGKKRTYYVYSKDVTTTIKTYRFFIGWNRIDYDLKNQGIWMLYIIDKNMDVDQQKDYVGDGLSENGIHLGKVRITHFFETILDYCNSKDVDKLYNSFSENIKESIKDLKNDILKIYSKYNFEYDTLYITEVKRDETNNDVYDISYTVKSNNDFFSYFIRICLSNDVNSRDYGVYAFYIVERNYEDVDLNTKPWWPIDIYNQGITVIISN